jgi:hypothetical protein
MNMQTQNRRNERKKLERRLEDRRQANLEFGSPEWVSYVKKNYVAWPKNDRRESLRRTGERRLVFQNAKNLKKLKDDYSSDLLTNEERLFFDQLFVNNSD